jgi:adenylate cyclase 10
MILVVGGQFMRCEYLCVGEALAKACMAETKALCGGETICSEQVINYVGNSFLYEETSGENIHGEVEEGEKFYRIKRMTGERIQAKSDAYLIRTKFNNEKLREKAPILKSFVPAAIVKYLDIEKESWSKEIRMLTIMFLNLKVDLSQTRTDEGIQRIQSIVKTVQRCVYRTRGALNKFLMDDKGSVMLICWGIPPISSQDDHIRGVQSGFLLSQELKKFNCEAYMGLTTGSCFTGVCGTIGGRREYSLLG